MLSRRAIPLLGMFNAISAFTQRRSGHKQKGTSIGKMGAADRTHLSAETTYVAISRDAPHLKTRNVGKLLSCLRCSCDAWWCRSGSPGSRGGALWRVASGPRLYLSFSTHFAYHLFKRKYVLCLVCLFVTQGSFFKLFSLFLRPSGALAQLPPLGLSYHLPRIVFQSHCLDHRRSPGLSFLFLLTGDSLPGVALSTPAVSTVTLCPEIWGCQHYAP